jgi:hypothetical protein
MTRIIGDESSNIYTFLDTTLTSLCAVTSLDNNDLTYIVQNNIPKSSTIEVLNTNIRTNLGICSVVDDYGADKWGVIDATTAFITAFDNNEVVYAPEGNYLISGSGFTIGTHQRLIGAGRYATILNIAGTSGIYVSGDAWEINNIGMYPATGNDYKFNGILVRGTSSKTSSHGTVDGLRIYRSKIGVELRGMIYFCDFSNLQVATALQSGIVLSYDPSGVGYPNANTFKLKFLTGVYSELITSSVDRTFTSTGHWVGTNWGISGSKLQHTVGSIMAATLPNANMTSHSLLGGYDYNIIFTISSMTSGSLTPKLGTGSGGFYTANGIYSSIVTCSDDNSDLTFVPTSGFDGSLDNISVNFAASASRIGIVSTGTTNHYTGGEINNFGIGVENTGSGIGHGLNYFENIFFEHNWGYSDNLVSSIGDYPLHNVSGTVYWNCTSGTSRIRKESGAVIVTPTNGYSDLVNVNPLNLPLRDCTGLYLFKEGTGASVDDSLHPGHSGSLAGGATWVNGLSYYGVQCDSTSSQYIGLPTDLIDPASIYTAIIAWKPVILSASPSYNDIIMFNKSSDYHRVYTSGPNVYYYYHLMVSGGSSNSEFVYQTYQETDAISILAFSYNPTLGKIYPRQPNGGGWNGNNVLTNLLTSPLTSIRLNGSTTSAHTIQYSLAAFWQRDLSYEEVLAFCNNMPILGLIYK